MNELEKKMAAIDIATKMLRPSAQALIDAQEGTIEVLESLGFITSEEEGKALVDIILRGVQETNEFYEQIVKQIKNQ